MANYDDSDVPFGFGFLLGVLVFCIIASIATHFAKVNISETEFLRFCMVKQIPLEECVIPGKLLDVQAHSK